MKKVLLLGAAALLFAGCTSKKAEVVPTPTAVAQVASPEPTAMPASDLPVSPQDVVTKTMEAKTSPMPNTKIAAMATIEMQDFAFVPGTIKVKAGQTVKVTNRDSVKHNVHATNDSFKTELLGKNESATFTAPIKAGSYNFVCDPHAKMMKGVLIVE